MKIMLCLCCLVFSLSSFALDKTQIKNSLEQMRKAGMFTEEQIKAAEKQLLSMSDEQLKALEKKGLEAAKDPKVQAKARELMQRAKEN